MNYSKSRTKIGCQKTQLEIVEDLDNDFPVQYGTELYRKIIIQVPLEVQKLQIMELQDVPTDHMRGGQRTQKCAPDKLIYDNLASIEIGQEVIGNSLSSQSIQVHKFFNLLYGIIISSLNAFFDLIFETEYIFFEIIQILNHII